MDRKKRLRTLFFATSVVFGIWAFTFAGAVGSTDPQPGEMGYLHGKYHDLYQHLTRNYFGATMDCCHGQDCRATLDLEPASPEEIADGVIGRVLVEGQWCPVRKFQLVDLPPEVKFRGRDDPHVQDFQNKTHVCARYGLTMPWFSDVPRPPQSKAAVCPVIFCVKEGGAKS